MPTRPAALTDSHKTLHAHARRETRKLAVWLPDLEAAAEELGVSRVYVMQLLADLEKRGAVSKLEGRRGIYLVEAEIPAASETGAA